MKYVPDVVLGKPSLLKMELNIHLKKVEDMFILI